MSRVGNNSSVFTIFFLGTKEDEPVLNDDAAEEVYDGAAVLAPARLVIGAL